MSLTRMIRRQGVEPDKNEEWHEQDCWVKPDWMIFGSQLVLNRSGSGSYQGVE